MLNNIFEEALTKLRISYDDVYERGSGIPQDEQISLVKLLIMCQNMTKEFASFLPKNVDSN